MNNQSSTDMSKARRIRGFLAERLHAYDYLVAGYAIFAVILASLVGFKLDFSVIFQFQYDKTFLAVVAYFEFVPIRRFSNSSSFRQMTLFQFLQSSCV